MSELVNPNRFAAYNEATKDVGPNQLMLVH